jgi:hypothetical protein
MKDDTGRKNKGRFIQEKGRVPPIFFLAGVETLTMHVYIETGKAVYSCLGN